MVEYTFTFDRVTIESTEVTDIVTGVYVVICAKYIEEDLQFSIGSQIILGPPQEIVIPFEDLTHDIILSWVENTAEVNGMKVQLDKMKDDYVAELAKHKPLPFNNEVPIDEVI